MPVVVRKVGLDNERTASPSEVQLYHLEVPVDSDKNQLDTNLVLQTRHPPLDDVLRDV